MANVIRVSVENADELLNAGAYDALAIVRLQSSATEAGAYTNEATATLVSGTKIYTLYDANGTTTTWYRTRYENQAGTNVSEWSAVFRTGATGICDLLDVRQRLGISDTSEDENLIEYIDQVTTYILGKTGREFLPYSGTRTYDVPYAATALIIPQGVRAITTLSYATTSQPDTGGTYTALAATDYYLRPLPHERDYGWTATRIELNTWTGALRFFTGGHSMVQAVGDFGWAEPPSDVAGIGMTLVTGLHRERGSSGGDSFTINIDGSRTFERMLSKRDRDVLDWYTYRVA